MDLCTYECTTLFPFFFILGEINLIEVNTVTNVLQLIEFGGFKSVSMNIVIHIRAFLFLNFRRM